MKTHFLFWLLPYFLSALVCGPLNHPANAAESLYCEPLKECDGLWIAAQPDSGQATFLYDLKGNSVTRDDLKVGGIYTSKTDINVHTKQGFKDNPFSLKSNTGILVKTIQALPWPSGGSQIWVQISAPDAAAIVLSPVFSTDVSKPNETCLNLPTQPPKAAFPIIDPPVLSNPISERDFQRLLFGRPIICDQYGLIVHQELNRQSPNLYGFNGGDTAQREGSYWFAVKVREKEGLPPWPIARRKTFDDVLKMLEPKADGVFYRHPYQEPYNHPYDGSWGTSRDQLIPLIAAMGIWGKYAELRRLWDALPEDALGKHAFNGSWVTIDGHPGTNCGQVNRMSCGPTLDCLPHTDTRTCTLQRDPRTCTQDTDTLNCGQPHDERNCDSWLGVHDPFCEAAKAGQNAIYDANGKSCLAQQAAQNAIYAGQKAACDASVGAQNAVYAQQNAFCLSQKNIQNGLYATGKLLCEAQKTGGKIGCEAQKSLETAKCLVSNRFTGDLMDPSAINFFRRAMDKDPVNSPDFVYWLYPIIVMPSAPVGDAILNANQLLLGVSTKGTPPQPFHDPDNVGDDLNNVIELVMSSLRYPSAGTRLAIETYRTARQHSYGSYLSDYYRHFGDKTDNLAAEIQKGIASGWKPTVSAPYGAFMWYYRPSEGANPQLGTIYEPIIGRLLQ